jgi:hypothetical protein
MRYVLVKVSDLSFAVINACEPSETSTKQGAYKLWIRAEHLGHIDGTWLWPAETIESVADQR